jgi:hypothetical protein
VVAAHLDRDDLRPIWRTPGLDHVAATHRRLKPHCLGTDDARRDAEVGSRTGLPLTSVIAITAGQRSLHPFSARVTADVAREMFVE